MCSWCNRWWQDARRRGRLWLHCGGNLTCFFVLFFLHPFFLLPLHPTTCTLSLSVSPALPLHHFLSLTSPLSLPFTVSSLQEVLELAFSVLYESDEYLNFIAPDKHEVSPQWLLTVSDRMNMCDRTKRGVFVIYKYSVYASAEVRYVLEIKQNINKLISDEANYIKNYNTYNQSCRLKTWTHAGLKSGGFGCLEH